MRIGFTGTQAGMTREQRIEFFSFIARHVLEIKEFHHGDCIGADVDAHDIMLTAIPLIKIIIHPPIKGIKRAYKNSPYILPPKDYIPRNHDIVDASDILIATPADNMEIIRSGTWATVRYARKNKIPCTIIYPNGRIGK